MSEPHLEDLPEAIPLHRVSPTWRLFALLAFLLAGLLLLFVIVLAVAIAGMRAQARATTAPATWTPPPAPMFPPSATTPVSPDTEPDEPPDAVNLPYPVRDDLRSTEPQSRRPNEPSPRARFLKKGEEVWKCPKEHQVSQVAISPDGQQIAYFQGQKLIVGPLANPQAVAFSTPDEGTAPFGRTGIASPPKAFSRDRRLNGRPVWSADSRSVYYADAGGRLYRYDSQTVQIGTLPFLGQSPAPVPGADQIVLVRSQPLAKVETPGSAAEADLSEIVVGNMETGTIRVLARPGKATWTNLAVSPDGKRLAAVCDQGDDNPRRWRLFVGSLANGKMEAVTPPARQIGQACWTADGKVLIYARGQEPMPADNWDNQGPFRNFDLFQYDLAAKKETRLSRGGGFISPSLGSDDSLYFLTWKADRNFRSRPRVQKMVLAGAQRFAQENEPPALAAKAWTALLDKVCKGAQVPENVEEIELNPDLMRRIAEQFDLVYRQLFQEEPPATQSALDRMARQEVPSLSWTPEQRNRLALIVGAVQGEFLRRQGKAEWHLGKGPLTGTDHPKGSDSPSGYVFNPFLLPSLRGRDDDDGNSRWLSLSFVRFAAEGRPVWLTNNPAEARRELAKRTVPELENGCDLLKQGQAEKAEKVLLGLLDQEANRENVYLALRVGRLLYDHDRLAALRKLMEQRCARPPRDARQFNLLGLALLKDAPDRALAAFKKALRCDLRFGPAYLNLAEAYEKAGDTNSARLCLQRYLDLMPYGPLAPDAARRLTALR